MLQLEKIETEILQRRETYNQAVEQYNAYRVRLPQAPLAGICNFEEAPYFETNSSDLDTLAEFKTGDTKTVEAIVRRAGERARTLAVTAHTQWQAGQQEQRGGKSLFLLSPPSPHTPSHPTSTPAASTLPTPAPLRQSAPAPSAARVPAPPGPPDLPGRSAPAHTARPAQRAAPCP